tara:strand:- start:528 stop:1049 length:522 start_codon:yes stop_codon:yes gene_type:complete
MKEYLFTIPYWSFDLSQDWKKNKSTLKRLIKKYPYSRSTCFYSNKDKTDETFNNTILSLIKKPLEQVSKEINQSLVLRKAWSCYYKKGDSIIVHKHSNEGLSGILYLNYNEKKNSKTIYQQPFQSFWNDQSFFIVPPVKEGTLVIVPSFIEHFTLPEKTDKIKEIISFDLKLN